jgi:hypothetical protein
MFAPVNGREFAAAILEALLGHRHDVRLAPVLLGDQPARHGHAGVVRRFDGRRRHLVLGQPGAPLGGVGQHPRPQRRVARNAAGNLSRRFRQPALLLGLHLPGDLPEQILPVRGRRRLPKQLLVLCLQRLYIHRGKLIDPIPEGLLHASTSFT